MSDLYDNLEKAMVGALDNLSERVAALEASAGAPAPSTRFYAVNKSDDDQMGDASGVDPTLSQLARLSRGAN
jgi:hypothetical protein